MEQDSGAPAAGTVTAEERTEMMKAAEGTQEAAQKLSGEQAEVPMEEGYVDYVAAPEFANSKFLVKAGTEVRTPHEGVNSPGARSRDGDIMAKFTNGVLVTKDPAVITWCDANPTKCRRGDHPFTKGWATLKEASTKRANRDAVEDASTMDADATFPPGGLDDLRSQAAKSGSVGDEAVKSAQLTKKSMEDQER